MRVSFKRWMKKDVEYFFKFKVKYPKQLHEFERFAIFNKRLNIKNLLDIYKNFSVDFMIKEICRTLKNFKTSIKSRISIFKRYFQLLNFIKKLG